MLLLHLVMEEGKWILELCRINNEPSILACPSFFKLSLISRWKKNCCNVQLFTTALWKTKMSNENDPWHLFKATHTACAAWCAITQQCSCSNCFHVCSKDAFHICLAFCTFIWKTNGFPLMKRKVCLPSSGKHLWFSEPDWAIICLMLSILLLSSSPAREP